MAGTVLGPGRQERASGTVVPTFRELTSRGYPKNKHIGKELS